MIDLEDFNTIKEYIEDQTGVVIPESNINAVKRFLKDKIGTDNLTVKEYLSNISEDQHEFHKLIKVVTINETYFFREERYYKVLNDLIFPELKSESIAPPVVWSGAASTGEEAISLSLLINKFWNTTNHAYAPVIASDIDIHSMKKLEENLYTKNSVRDDGKIFHDLLMSNSSYKDDKLILNKNIIDSISTHKLNLITDDFATLFTKRPKVIFLCNVLIYMEPEIRNRIIDKAVDILDNGGYLFVSSSNTATVEHNELELICEHRSFYFKKKVKE